MQQTSDRDPRGRFSILRCLWRLSTGAAVLLAAGCLQIETRVTLHEDGSAKVTERVYFSERLLDLTGDRRADFVLLLGRERVLERMKDMGAGVTLVRHELRSGSDGSMESLAEMAVPDLNQFRYVSPWPGYLDYAENNSIRAALTPRYKSHPYSGGPAGSMSVSFVCEKRPVGQAAPAKGAPLPKVESPRESQVYRDIAPVVKDMLKGFRVRFTFESYAPVHSGLGVRGGRASAPAIDLIDVSDSNLDRWGGLFLENEEVMLEILRGDTRGPNVVQNVAGYDRNLTLPVFTPFGSPLMWFTGGDNIWFAPSKPLFDRHFAGKKLDYSAWADTPLEKQPAADFEKIGWHGWKRKSAEDKKPGGTGGEAGGARMPGPK